jgi:predicted alpha/beta-hydrolase family hydrolase
LPGFFYPYSQLRVFLFLKNSFPVTKVSANHAFRHDLFFGHPITLTKDRFMDNQLLPYSKEVEIEIPGRTVKATFCLPPHTKAVVIFCHGTGSSRHSAASRYIANRLLEDQIGSLLFSLEYVEEDLFYKGNSNIAGWSERLVAVTHYVMENPESAHLPIGYLASGTGIAVAIMASIELKDIIRCIVCRRGDVEQAQEQLSQITAPALFVVGGKDEKLVALHHYSLPQLRCRYALEIIPGAGNLLVEEESLTETANLAVQWFIRFLFRVTQPDTKALVL